MFLFLINKCLNSLYLDKYLESFSIIFTKYLLLDFTHTIFINNTIIMIILQI